LSDPFFLFDKFDEILLSSVEDDVGSRLPLQDFPQKFRRSHYRKSESEYSDDSGISFRNKFEEVPYDRDHQTSRVYFPVSPAPNPL
jgi:hypothetical protein